MELYTKIYEVKNLLDRETEYNIMLDFDIELKRQCYIFHKGIKTLDIDDMSSVCVLNDSQLSNLNKLMDLTGIRYALNDITDCSILGEYISDREDINLFISDFLEENLTVDMVLDKINLKGIDSLSDIDKNILSKK